MPKTIKIELEFDSYADMQNVLLVYELLRNKENENPNTGLEDLVGDDIVMAILYLMDLLGSSVSGPFLSPSGKTYFSVAGAEITNPTCVRYVEKLLGPEK